MKDSEEHVFIRVGKSSWMREKGNGLIVGHVSIIVASSFVLVSSDYWGSIRARELGSFWNAECAENFQSHFVLVVTLILESNVLQCPYSIKRSF